MAVSKKVTDRIVSQLKRYQPILVAAKREILEGDEAAAARATISKMARKTAKAKLKAAEEKETAAAKDSLKSTPETVAA